MYRPKQGREQEQRTNRPERSQFIRAALPVLTVVFWVAAAICVVMIALYAFAWVEFRSNPAEDAERGDWTNKMLCYGLVFAITFFVAFLYWASLIFAR